jgi:hypothetical protein
MSFLTQISDLPEPPSSFFSSPQCPDHLWANTTFYPMGMGMLFPKGLKVTIRLLLVPRLKCVELHLSL